MKLFQVVLILFWAGFFAVSCENHKNVDAPDHNTVLESDVDFDTQQTINPNSVITNSSSSQNQVNNTPVERPDAPHIIFDMLDKDFGTINEGEMVEVLYTFKNSGGSDLVVSNVQAGCGCTIPDWPKDPIRPGKSGIIKAKFDSNGRQGKNEKHITVMSNAVEGDVLLKFHGEVKGKY